MPTERTEGGGAPYKKGGKLRKEKKTKGGGEGTAAAPPPSPLLPPITSHQEAKREGEKTAASEASAFVSSSNYVAIRTSEITLGELSIFLPNLRSRDSYLTFQNGLPLLLVFLLRLPRHPFLSSKSLYALRGQGKDNNGSEATVTFARTNCTSSKVVRFCLHPALLVIFFLSSRLVYRSSREKGEGGRGS